MRVIGCEAGLRSDYNDRLNDLWRLITSNRIHMVAGSVTETVQDPCRSLISEMISSKSGDELSKFASIAPPSNDIQVSTVLSISN